MNLNEYQKQARETAVYHHIGNNLCYTALGLAGEAGEVANKVKKVFRDGLKEDDYALGLADELGDVLWYVAMLAHEIGYDLELVAQYNIEKLKRRKGAGTLHGQGDRR